MRKILILCALLSIAAMPPLPPAPVKPLQLRKGIILKVPAVPNGFHQFVRVQLINPKTTVEYKIGNTNRWTEFGYSTNTGFVTLAVSLREEAYFRIKP